MQSLREVYRIGKGPSSSHTMAPSKGAKEFLSRNSNAEKFRCDLFGSLALTGDGHQTVSAIKEILGENTTFNYYPHQINLPHPNTMDFYAIVGEKVVDKMRAFSIGGGAIEIEGEISNLKEVYQFNTFNEIKSYCESRDIRIPHYVREREPEIFQYLQVVWDAMKESIRDGLNAVGTLPGPLDITRKAKLLYSKKHIDESPETRENRIVCANAFAVSEQNASGGIVVTAPTCGASGVLPAVLKYMQDKHKLSDEIIVNALATAGIIGNIIKTNASISGAECGCQAEIGSACSMASSALAEIFEMDLNQIEYAAEVAMEHHLGLTCDPVLGLVQIPCIERNAVAAMRAINALSLANFLSDTRKVSFDSIVQTMYETGKDLKVGYRETSLNGLAKLYKK